MSGFDLLADAHELIEDEEPLKSFVSNLNGVEKLWRITDLSKPNYFKLRPIDQGKISLMDMLSDFTDNNSTVNEFDLFFYFMVIHKLKRKHPKHLEQLLNLNSVYLKINLLIQTIRSTPDFFKKISYIKLTPGNEEKPYCQHWEMLYTDPKYDEDKDLINLLERCCEKSHNFPSVTEEYIDYIYKLEPKMQQQVA